MLTGLNIGKLWSMVASFRRLKYGMPRCLSKGPISLAETLPWLVSHGNSGDSGDQKIACALTKETSPDKVTTMIHPEVMGTSPRRLLSCGDVSVVSSRSWRHRRDVADKISLRDVAATVGDVAQMSPRPAGGLKRLQKFFKNCTCLNFPRLPGDRASLRNQRRLESPAGRHLVSRPVR